MNKLNSVAFRNILIGIIVALLGAIGGGYYFLNQQLVISAKDTVHARIDTQLSAEETKKLEKVGGELNQYQDVIARAKELTASTSDFKYQEQVIGDIRKLAGSAGIQITGYSFGGDSANTSAAPTTGSTPAPTTNTAGGIKKITVTIAVKSPIKYDSYLRFLRLLESNVQRLQVTGVNLTPDGTDKSMITNPSIGIEVFVRE